MSMKCIKILVLVSLIPIVLRGASLLGYVILPSSSENSKNAASVNDASSSEMECWRSHRRRRMESLTASFNRRRFSGSNGGGDGDGGGGFFRDQKRFAPTGSNPLHNL